MTAGDSAVIDAVRREELRAMARELVHQGIYDEWSEEDGTPEEVEFLNLCRSIYIEAVATRDRSGFTKVLRTDGRTAIKVALTREARALGLEVGDEVVLTLRPRN